MQDQSVSSSNTVISLGIYLKLVKFQVLTAAFMKIIVFRELRRIVWSSFGSFPYLKPILARSHI